MSFGRRHADLADVRWPSGRGLRVSRRGDADEVRADDASVGVARGEPAVDGPRSRTTPTAVATPAGLGSGASLDAKTRASMEPWFGFDFASVRVHADDAAARSADALGARAYTVGQHIVFAEGCYRPDAANGRQLLAHELAHVVQQSAGAVQIQRDEAKGAPASTEADAVRAELATIEQQWGFVKQAAKGSKLAAPWVASGDTVVGLLRDHVSGAIAARAAGDTWLARQYAAVIETDLVAYQYVTWHAFAYQNIDRTRGWAKDLVEAFDADDRAFTGRADAEEGARALKALGAKVDQDSARWLALLTTDVAYQLGTASGGEVAVVLTSAADEQRRTAMAAETAETQALATSVEVIVYNLNSFVGVARGEGLAQAIDAVEQYYGVKKLLEAGKGGGQDKKPSKKDRKDKKPREDEQKQPAAEPQPQPIPPVGHPPDEGDGGRWGCDDVRCNVYPLEDGAKCPDRVIGSSRGHPSERAACLAAQRNANAQVPRGCNKRHCNCNGKCRKM